MPRMTVPQFMLGFVLGVIGYPFSLTLSASIFSKVVGDINPGYWLGLFNTFGSSARVIGPLLVTEVYQELGTYAMTFLVISVLVRRQSRLCSHWLEHEVADASSLMPRHGSRLKAPKAPYLVNLML